MQPAPYSPHTTARLGEDRGSVFVEYAVLLSLVAVGLSLAIASLGYVLIRTYLIQQTWLLLPFP